MSLYPVPNQSPVICQKRCGSLGGYTCPQSGEALVWCLPDGWELTCLLNDGHPGQIYEEQRNWWKINIFKGKYITTSGGNVWGRVELFLQIHRCTQFRERAWSTYSLFIWEEEGGMNVVIHSPGHSELPAEYSFSAGEGESVGSRSDCVGGRKRSILMWGTAANTKSPILNSRKFCQRTTLNCSQSRACLWERNVEQGWTWTSVLPSRKSSFCTWWTAPGGKIFGQQVQK